MCKNTVACNVYVSAGAVPGHRGILLDILKRTQEKLGLTTPSADGKHPLTAIVVHAYCNPTYNRSSFHLAGTPDCVSGIASQLASRAISKLRRFDAHNFDDYDPVSCHPQVGLVDHVSVMPLQASDCNDDLSPVSFPKDQQPITPSGRAARAVGQALSLEDVNVLYYGTAHPDGDPLALVRRNRTNFFQSQDSSSLMETATVGAPEQFVENYNIRLKCGKKTAMSLTKLVRERDGGIPGVEALTLPYRDQWEVACNLLRPAVGTVEQIRQVVETWQAKQTGDNDDENIVQKQYRVGTTVEQCIAALQMSPDQAADHNRKVHDSFVANFTSEEP